MKVSIVVLIASLMLAVGGWLARSLPGTTLRSREPLLRC
jgi:hypothetical protein